MKKIGKYEILEVLGEGGMGIVYKAYDPLMEREVAVKVLSESVFNLPEIKERFYREARSAGKLSHENITIVHDLGEIDGKPFIVMEYLKGTDLRTIIDKKESLTLDQKLEYARQICRGLAFSHAKDIIHRDIKPANIRILDHDKIKIMDFGIAKPLTSTMTQTGIVMGTPHYMSPEQIKGQTVDKRSDIFSFGALFYELLTYEIPFTGNEPTTIMYKIVHEEPNPIEDLKIENISGIRDIILKCLKKDSNKRYQNFSEIVNLLDEILHARKASENRRLEEKRKKIEKLIANSQHYLKKNNFKKAREVVEKAAILAPDNTNVIKLADDIKQREENEKQRLLIQERLNSARKLFNAKQYEKIKEVLEEVLNIDPQQSEAVKFIAEAEKELKLEQENKKIAQLMVEGRDYFNKYDLVKAEEKIEAVLQINPKHSEAAKLLKEIKIQKIAQDSAKTILLDTKVEPEEKTVVAEVEPRIPKSRRSKRIYLVLSLLILIVGMGLGYRYFIYTPEPPIAPMGYVSLNILPWAEITKIENNENGKSVIDKKMITPCRLSLPAGKYMIYLTNADFADSLILPIEIKNGEIQEIKNKMPGFDYTPILTNF